MTIQKQANRLCTINLTEKTVSASTVNPEVLRTVSGGRGYNAWHLSRHLPPGADPLGPENLLLFTCGQLTGTAAPVSSRLHISGLSPQTGLLGSSNIGGDFGAWLRAVGYLSLLVQGRSEAPVLLVIEPDRVWFADGAAWWGLDTWQTHDRIREHFGPRARALSIGPAGEHGIPFACILHSLDHAAGRTGLGAVMGSKKLKAIVITDTPKAQKAGLPQVNGCSREFVRKVKQSPHYQEFARHGGAGSVLWCNDLGLMPTRNYQEHRFSDADHIDGKLLESSTRKRTRCYRCFIGCKAELALNDLSAPDRRANRPEFEPMVNLGARCGLSDIKAVVHLDNLCSRLGLDCISAAGVLAFGMELFEKGILTREETGGLELAWGSAAAMEVLLGQIARREGLGRILGQGVKKAAEHIGRGSDAFAYQVKGLELSAYHPARIRGTALGYAVSNRGGDFNTLYASLEYNWTKEQALQAFGSTEAVDLQGTKGKGRMIKQAACVNAVLDSLGLCKIPTLSLLCDFSLEEEAALFRAVTGDAVSAGELMEMGERIISLERGLNCRLGAGRKDDRLQDFFVKSGSSGEDWLKPLVEDYYAAMGWDADGNPP